MGLLTVELSTALRASAEDVWAHASTMAGVNQELGPWVRMTVPDAVRGMRLVDAPVGREAFTSVLLLFGVLPFDVHHLTLERVHERGFDEESWSWLQRRCVERLAVVGRRRTIMSMMRARIPISSRSFPRTTSIA